MIVCFLEMENEYKKKIIIVIIILEPLSTKKITIVINFEILSEEWYKRKNSFH